MRAYGCRCPTACPVCPSQHGQHFFSQRKWKHNKNKWRSSQMYHLCVINVCVCWNWLTIMQLCVSLAISWWHCTACWGNTPLGKFAYTCAKRIALWCHEVSLLSSFYFRNKLRFWKICGRVCSKLPVDSVPGSGADLQFCVSWLWALHLTLVKQVKIFKIKKWMAPLKPPYNILHFINTFLSPNFCTFWDMDQFLHPSPKLSAFPNLNFLAWRTYKL